MRLMVHPDPEVQSQALKCVQKVLLSKDKSDFLANVGGGGSSSYSVMA